MPDELGIYVVIVFGLFWILIAFSGVIMKAHDRINDRHNRYQH